MEKTRRQRGPQAALTRFHHRHGQRVAVTADVLTILSVCAGLLGSLPVSPAWVWPAAVVLAVAGALLALYRAHELALERNELQKAFDGLCKVTGALMVTGTQDFARAAGIAQDLPIVELAGLVAALRQAGADPKATGHALELLAQYERLVTDRADH